MTGDESDEIDGPGGCTALSAVLSGAYRPAEGERVGVVVSGANTTGVSFASERSG